MEKKDTRRWAEILAKNGQALLPMVELIAPSKLAVDGLVDRVGSGKRIVDRSLGAPWCRRLGRLAMRDAAWA